MLVECWRSAAATTGGANGVGEVDRLGEGTEGGGRRTSLSASCMVASKSMYSHLAVEVRSKLSLLTGTPSCRLTQ